MPRRFVDSWRYSVPAFWNTVVYNTTLSCNQNSITSFTSLNRPLQEGKVIHSGVATVFCFSTELKFKFSPDRGHHLEFHSQTSQAKSIYIPSRPYAVGNPGLRWNINSGNVDARRWKPNQHTTIIRIWDNITREFIGIAVQTGRQIEYDWLCLLYTSDAADE